MIISDKTEEVRPEPAGTTPPVGRNHTPLSAGGWSLASYVISYAVGALIFIPLARFLNPEDFGLYTEASIFYAAVAVMIEMPLIRGLIRSTGDQRQAAQAVLWLSIWLGLGGTVVCALLGFPLSQIYRLNTTIPEAANIAFRLYGQKTVPVATGQELIPIMFLLSLAVLATALGVVPLARLSRDLNFRRKLLPDTISLAVGAGVALVTALLGAGVYSLILYALARALANAGIAWLVAGYRPERRRATWAEMRSFLPFVVPASGGELALQARFNMDFAIGGAQLGSSALGIYTLAWDSADKPAKLVNSFFNQVGFASFARLQKNLPRVRGLYFSATRLLASVTLPLFLSVLFLRQDLVAALLGAKWQNTVDAMFPLFILQALWIIFQPASGLVLALGHSRVFATVNGLSLVFTVAAVIVGAANGILGLAWAMLLASGLTSVSWGGLVLLYIEPTRSEVWQAARIPLIMTLAVLPAVALTDTATNLAHLPAILRLGLTIAVGGAVFVVAGWRCLPSLRQDLARMREALPTD